MKGYVSFIVLFTLMLVFSGLMLSHAPISKQISPLNAYAASPTPTAQVTSTPAMTNVYRIGVNMGNQGQYAESDFMQNMFDNPGFELGQECWAWIVGSSPSSSGFNTTNDNGEANGFWNGASASVRAGASAGNTFTVATSVSGGTYTCSGSCPSLNTSDVVSMCVSSPSLGLAHSYQGFGGWTLLDTAVNPTTAQKYEGNSSLGFSVADGGTHAAEYYFDNGVSQGGVCTTDKLTPCTVANEATDCASEGSVFLNSPSSGPNHPVVGSFQVSFYALTIGTSAGTPQIAITLQRQGGGTNISHAFALTNDGAWHKYTYAFTGTDVAADAKNQMLFTMTASNGSAESGAMIYVDDAYLGRAESSATGFRDEVVTTLNTL